MMHKIELIQWLDHCSLGDDGVSWFPLARAMDLEPEIIFTVGWVIKETDEFLISVSSFGDGNDTIADDTLIIKSCIKSRKVLLDDAECQK